jgi:LEA14-like dessication related protein
MLVRAGAAPVRRRVCPLGLALGAVLAGCAALSGVSRPPELALSSIEGVELGLLEQRYQLKLRLRNPNDVDLHVRGLSLAVELNGKPFARGVSDQVVTVPRMGEALLEVSATSSLGSVWRQLREVAKASAQDLSYRLSGQLSLQGLGNVSFDEKGVLPMP